ncbi:hypothetical protein LTR15_002351 [Elasticomyces elasticus]|nr:hypothetical protein LTR15_002351 [Elasticomyces elasticus]
MDQLPKFGKAIQDIVGPTFALYTPLLQQNEAIIKSVQRETFSYGSHERQKLDVYTSPAPSIVNGRHPVLMLEYGGGLIRGSRNLPMFGDHLVHANVGSFFALKYGYTVVVADYRLMSHGAKFPSGGEDIALAVEWMTTNQVGTGTEPIDLYIMGNSAGGIHLSTFLLHPEFAETRQKVLSGDTHESRTDTLEAYFGNYEANAPLGLLKAARKAQTPLDIVKGGARVLVLNAELDPDDEILRPGIDFVEEWLLMDDIESRNALAVDSMTGHNHVSPFAALSTGVDQEEAWGCQVAAFCDTIRKFKPRSKGDETHQSL